MAEIYPGDFRDASRRSQELRMPVTDYTATGIPIYTGLRGGRCHYSKVYERP